MERRRQESFDLIEEAERFMNLSKYNRSLDYYQAAELILNEIGYPTDSLREVILKVQEKKREHQLKQQK